MDRTGLIKGKSLSRPSSNYWVKQLDTSPVGPLIFWGRPSGPGITPVKGFGPGSSGPGHSHSIPLRTCLIKISDFNLQ